MNKQGFTLAEVLIAIGIVGVCAAVLAPAIVNIMPDKNKVKVIQYHSVIANATIDLLNDDAIYYRKIDYDTEVISDEDFNGDGVINDLDKVKIYKTKKSETNFTDENGDIIRTITTYEKTCKGGLDCTEPSVGLYCKDSEGEKKYRTCLFDKLGMNKDADTAEYKDGSKWTVEKDSSSHTYKITIDVDGGEGDNCTYDSSECKNPDKFIFEVDQWGGVTPVDKLSKTYLKNVTRTNAKKDKEEAANIE